MARVSYTSIAALVLSLFFALLMQGGSFAADTQGLIKQGKELYQKGDFKRAVATLREAVALDPKNRRLWRAYNEAYQADAATRYMTTLTGKYNAITYHEYLGRKKENPDLVLIDLRAPKDFETEHIPDAINIPLEEMRFRLNQLPELKIREIVVYCVAGPRSATGQMYLSMLGYTNVKYFQGGIRRWKDYKEIEESEETIEGIEK